MWERVEAHCLYGEATSCLRSGNYDFYSSRNEVEFVIRARSEDRKTKTTHTFWPAREHGHYLPYLMAQHNLEQRIPVSDTRELICEAGGCTDKNQWTAVSLGPRWWQKQRSVLIPKVIFTPKTAGLAAAQVRWQHGALRAAAELTKRYSSGNLSYVMRCSAAYRFRRYGLIACTLEKSADGKPAWFSIVYSKYVTRNAGISVQTDYSASPGYRCAAFGAVWHSELGVDVVVNATTWKETSAALQYRLSRACWLRVGIRRRKNEGTQVGVQLSCYP